MAESFDPYRKWLGIPPRDRPPHHYRLLGIEPLESDPEVISNAADGRMAQVKYHQSGKHAELSQQILNEIAKAKVCLLNPEKKARYDRALRQRLAAKNKTSAPSVTRRQTPAASPKVGVVTGPEIPRIQTSAGSSCASDRVGTKQGWRIPAIVAVIALLIIAMLAFLLSQVPNTNLARQSESPRSPHGKAATSVVPPAVTKPPDTKPPVLQGKPTEPALPNSVPKGAEPELPEPRPRPPDLNALVKEEPDGPLERSGVPLQVNHPDRLLDDLLDPVKPGQPEKIGTGDPGSKHLVLPAPHLNDSSGAKRLPIPDRSVQKDVEEEIREIFKEEFAAATTPDQKLALATKLFNQAKGAKEAPADRFVLMQTASDLAAGVGKLKRALNMVDRMQQLYAVDPLEMKARVITAVVDSMRDGPQAPERYARILSTATQLAESAVRIDDFDAASRFVKLAILAARKAADGNRERELKIRERELNRLGLKFASVEKARKVLVDDPTSGDANLTVGRWLGFTKGDWAKGLPLLLKGSDTKLAEVAKRDIGKPNSAKDQVALADDWSKLAKKEGNLAKRQIQLRAARWYERALPQLPGLEKVKVEKKLAAIKSSDTPMSAKIQGVIRKGNVALASNGTTVAGVAKGGPFLIDGHIPRKYTRGTYAIGSYPCKWAIHFREVYRLTEIRLRLFDYDPRFYRYAIETSSDGKNYAPLMDRSRGQWQGWQRIAFAPRAVKSVRLIGLFGSKNKYFHVLEFEAYCIPPK